MAVDSDKIAENMENKTTVNPKEQIKTVPKTETKAQETKKVETEKPEIITEKKVFQEETPKKVEEKNEQEEVVNIAAKCASGNHGIGVGNTGKWFNTKEEAIAEYETEIKRWGDKWTNFEIDDETYYSNCPSGYEVWNCPYCNKWTLNYYK